jgi:hypothetical protein
MIANNKVSRKKQTNLEKNRSTVIDTLNHGKVNQTNDVFYPTPHKYKNESFGNENELVLFSSNSNSKIT